jgi:MoaA/NifB/PqqE/SkfB family radical SAM enzyme
MRNCLNAVWNISSKCNYSCPYCGNEISKKAYENLTYPAPDLWAKAWNRIEEELIIDITGGEPLLWEGLIDFIYLLDEDKRVAITTNGRVNLTEFVQKVPPQKCINMTMSYHPSQHVDLHYFIGKVLMLKNRGFNVNVNFVAYPEQMWIIPELIKVFSQHDILMNVDPYLQNSETPYYTFNESEIVFLKQYITGNRKVCFERRKLSSMCDAGSGYFVVMPNGDVYRCITKSFQEASIGNFLDEEFKLMTGPSPCQTSCIFGCDMDHTCREPLNKVSL